MEIRLNDGGGLAACWPRLHLHTVCPSHGVELSFTLDDNITAIQTSLLKKSIH